MFFLCGFLWRDGTGAVSKVRRALCAKRYLPARETEHRATPEIKIFEAAHSNFGLRTVAIRRKELCCPPPASPPLFSREFTARPSSVLLSPLVPVVSHIAYCISHIASHVRVFLRLVVSLVACHSSCKDGACHVWELFHFFSIYTCC